MHHLFNFINTVMAAGKKTGGRKKGTPNKATVLGKDIIVTLLSDYSASGLMAADFKALDPKDRLIIAEKLLNYALPKMQSAAVDLTSTARSQTIEDRLAALAATNPDTPPNK